MHLMHDRPNAQGFATNLRKHTAVTSFMAQSCSSLTFSTKKGVMPIEETLACYLSFEAALSLKDPAHQAL